MPQDHPPIELRDTTGLAYRFVEFREPEINEEYLNAHALARGEVLIMNTYRGVHLDSEISDRRRWIVEPA